MRKYIAISPNVQMLKSEVAIVSMIMVCIILFGLMTFIGVGLYKKIAIRFDLNMPSLQDVHHITMLKNRKTEATFKILSLPLYMVENRNSILVKLNLYKL